MISLQVSLMLLLEIPLQLCSFHSPLEYNNIIALNYYCCDASYKKYESTFTITLKDFSLPIHFLLY